MYPDFIPQCIPSADTVASEKKMPVAKLYRAQIGYYYFLYGDIRFF